MFRVDGPDGLLNFLCPSIWMRLYLMVDKRSHRGLGAFWGLQVGTVSCFVRCITHGMDLGLTAKRH